MPDGNISIERMIDARRDRVFRAWTDPKELVRWFAPVGCTIQFKKLDLREGGSFHSCLTIPGGRECWAKGIYLEISPPERIVFVMAVTDSEGNFVQPIDLGMDPEWPRETVITVTFEDLGGRTKMILHQTASEAVAKRTGAYHGWGLMLDLLEVSIASQEVA